MNIRSTIIALTATAALSTAALADWPNSNPTKWVQLPDRTPTGIDVLDTSRPGVVGKILADDFECKQTGYISDIHIWGSWLYDQLPSNAVGQPDAGNVRFKLSIHDDIPATPTSHSRPVNPPLWTKVFGPGDFVVRQDGDPGPELFYNPNTNQYMGTDTQIWQYNFYIDPTEAFLQVGTPDVPKVYWLDVQAEVIDQNAVFGWKTSEQHWNDDAVYGDTVFGGDPDVWNELVYPSTPLPPGYPLPTQQHPYAGNSMDLAFALTTIPEPSTTAFVAFALIALLRMRRR